VNSAATRVIHPIPIPIFIPTKIEGIDPGIKTLKNMSLSLALSVLAASRKILLTESTPEIVLSKMGKKEPKKIIKAADLMPIPNHRMAMGIHAKGGIGLIISMMGLIMVRSLEDHPINTPRGIPTKQAILNPNATLYRLYRTWLYNR